MKRFNPLWVLVVLALAAMTYWIAENSEWVEIKVPMPPKGEALRNRFYAAQRLAETLGAKTTAHDALAVLPSDSVLVLAGWHWTLTASRRLTLEQWVESGGRLVVVGPLAGGDAEFTAWAGIARLEPRTVNSSERDTADEDPCGSYLEERGGSPPAPSEAKARWLCNFDTESNLIARRRADWALRGPGLLQAMRTTVGRGRVTVINSSTAFSYRSLFDGDHGWLFVAATDLRRGDDVHFLSEADHPSLLALLWRHGGPIVVLSLAIVGLMLWRSSARFGPLAAPEETARRSLAEQIRGTGLFALRHGGGESLHAATVHALEDAAKRRIPGYAGLPAADRAAALARLTGFDRDALAAAVHHGGLRSPHGLRGTIAFLEAARRQVLIKHARSVDGTA
jgi:hypothetical protein